MHFYVGNDVIQKMVFSETQAIIILDKQGLNVILIQATLEGSLA